MRLRARRNGKGTHEGCLCCIFARCRGQKHRGNTFLMPLFGGVGQTGEGREGQTGVEEDAGVSGLGRVLLILGCGGGVVVIRTSQRFALCGTADGTGLGGGVGGIFPGVFRLVNLRMAGRAFMPVVVHIALPFGCGIGVGCLLFFYFRGITAAGAGVIGFPAYRCAGGGLGFVVDEGVVVGVSVAIRLTASAALCRRRARSLAAGVDMGQV